MLRAKAYVSLLRRFDAIDTSAFPAAFETLWRALSVQDQPAFDFRVEILLAQLDSVIAGTFPFSGLCAVIDTMAQEAVGRHKTFNLPKYETELRWHNCRVVASSLLSDIIKRSPAFEGVGFELQTECFTCLWRSLSVLDDGRSFRSVFRRCIRVVQGDGRVADLRFALRSDFDRRIRRAGEEVSLCE